MSIRVLASIVFSLWTVSTYAGGQISVDPGSIFSTQQEIGKRYVDKSVYKVFFERMAKGKSLTEAVASRPLPGVYLPDGRLVISDGHHWGTAAQWIKSLNASFQHYAEQWAKAHAPGNEAALVRELNAEAGQVKVVINLTGDFRAGGPTPENWKNCVDDLYQNGIGYLKKDIRERYGLVDAQGKARALKDIDSRKLVESYRSYLFKPLSQLEDSPGRSLVGTVLDSMGIVAEDNLVDYIEFYVAENLNSEFEKEHINLSALKDRPPEAYTPELIGKVQDIMLERNHVVQYLLDHIRPGKDPAGIAKSRALIIQKFKERIAEVNQSRALASELGGIICGGQNPLLNPATVR